MPSRSPLVALVLAAGQGKRMRSKTVKLLHPVAGRPMVSHVLDTVRALRPTRTLTVVGFQAEPVREALEDSGTEFVLQREQRGTGHAVLAAASRIGTARGGVLLILNGDLPTLRSTTLRGLVAGHRRRRAALSVLTVELDEPAGYGRIVRDERGAFLRIVEHGDASPKERRIREINCGIYVADPARLLPALRRLRPDNAQGEYYLPDAVHALLAAGSRVEAVRHAGDAAEVLGVNTRAELSRAGRELYARSAARLLEQGVTLLDPDRTWVDPRARIARDVVLYPDVLIEGATVIGEDTVVRQSCRIADCRIGNAVEIRDHSVLIGSRVGNGAKIGPFAHLRPDSVLEREAHVGNFVELKKTRLGARSKANHLTYLGDATIGADCNIGAGTITCNYDGRHKHPTELGRRVFIGSATQLVAPVRVSDGAYVAAGTTVTEDVPSGALAIGRGRQRNVEGWVARRDGAARRDRRRILKD